MVQDQLWRQFEGSVVEGVYVLNELLGAGAYGGVFRAEHRLAGNTVRQVAIKLILPDYDHLDYQLPEISRGINLSHGNVISYHSAGEVSLNGTRLLYLILELAEDGTLAQRLLNGPMPLDDVEDLVYQVASGLEYLHDLRIVHRDIKPANLLRAGKLWKISDLGAVRYMNCKTLSQTQLVFGTLRFMPPESFSGTVSPAWDIWSLGVATVEASTGKPLFAADSEVAMQWQILNDDPLAGVRMPERFESLVRGCLRKQPLDRWTARQVMNALRQPRIAEASTAATKSYSQPNNVLPRDEATIEKNLRRMASEAFLAGATDEGFRLLRKMGGGKDGS